MSLDEFIDLYTKKKDFRNKVFFGVIYIQFAIANFSNML